MIRLGDAIYTYVSEYDPQAGGSTVCSAPPWTRRCRGMLIGVGLTSHAGAATGEIVVDQIRIDEAWHSLDLCQSRRASRRPDLSLDFTSTSLTTNFHVVSKNATTSSQRLERAPAAWPTRSSATWRPPSGSSPGRDRTEARAGGFHAEFDVYMSRAGLPASETADGVTFAVVEGGDTSTARTRWRPPPWRFRGVQGFAGGTLIVNSDCRPSFAVELDNYVNIFAESAQRPANSGGSPS